MVKRRLRAMVLMTTGTYRARAFVDAARRSGVELTVASERRQILAAANPEGHLVVDFRTPDEAAGEIVRFAAGTPLDAVLTADDEGAAVASRAVERLGLRGHPVAAVECARDKLNSRRCLAAAGRPVPEFWFSPSGDVAELLSVVRFPCVIKPRRLSASRGVIRVDDAETFPELFARVSAIAGEAGVLVESYLPGDEVAVEGIVDRGRWVPLAVFDKPYPLVGPYFEETIYVTPSRRSEASVDAILCETREAAAALGLDDGPLHAELRIVDEVPTVIEIAPRSIGGLCSRSLRFDGARSLESLLLAQALALEWTPAARERPASGVMMLPIPGAGVLSDRSGEEQALAVPGVTELIWSIPVGQQIAPPPDGARYLGFLFAQGERPADVVDALERAHRRLDVRTEPAWRSGGPPSTMGRGEAPC